LPGASLWSQAQSLVEPVENASVCKPACGYFAVRSGAFASLELEERFCTAQTLKGFGRAHPAFG
jgi:hypothetical protein